MKKILVSIVLAFALALTGSTTDSTIETEVVVNPWACGSTITYEGKRYPTVEIGTQCWMKENLDVGTMINSSQDPSNNNEIEKYCYNNDLANCETYGGLYQWSEAMHYVSTQGTQGICPSGWHIPTIFEFLSLESYVSDLATKIINESAKSGYTYTNTTGFSALFGGFRFIDDGDFHGLGGSTTF